jgi:hypothetical protein
MRFQKSIQKNFVQGSFLAIASMFFFLFGCAKDSEYNEEVMIPLLVTILHYGEDGSLYPLGNVEGNFKTLHVLSVTEYGNSVDFESGETAYSAVVIHSHHVDTPHGMRREFTIKHQIPLRFGESVKELKIVIEGKTKGLPAYGAWYDGEEVIMVSHKGNPMPRWDELTSKGCIFAHFDSAGNLQLALPMFKK